MQYQCWCTGYQISPLVQCHIAGVPGAMSHCWCTDDKPLVQCHIAGVTDDNYNQEGIQFIRALYGDESIYLFLNIKNSIISCVNMAGREESNSSHMLS